VSPYGYISLSLFPKYVIAYLKHSVFANISALGHVPLILVFGSGSALEELGAIAKVVRVVHREHVFGRTIAVNGNSFDLGIGFKVHPKRPFTKKNIYVT
jgi:hypothetical protein